MSKTTKQDKEKLEEFVNSEEAVRITCLSQGFYNNNISLGPCIFIGPKNKTLLLWKNEVTIEVLSKILNKAIKDNNVNAAIAILHYAVHNKKRFWQRHKHTKLGTRVMADILGKHE